MKKNLFRLFAGAALSLFIFSSCGMIDYDNGYSRTAVTVEPTTNGVSIGFPKINNSTKVISIHRYSTPLGVTPSNPTKIDPIGTEGDIIGLIYPDQYPNDEVYIFIDELSARPGKYCYRVRYTNSDDDYSYTKWSDPIDFSASSNMGLTYELILKDNTIDLDGAYNLKLGAKTEWEDDVASNFKTDFSKIYLALKCSKENQAYLFPLNQGQADADVSIPLSTIIPLNWYDKEVTVQGLVAVKTISGEKAPKQHIFTVPAVLTGKTTFTYSSASQENNIDYL